MQDCCLFHFKKSPMQFTAIQSSLGRVDKMNEYITHIGSGLFACFGGGKTRRVFGTKNCLNKTHHTVL